MKRLFSAAMVIAALGFATACGGTSTPRDTAPADQTGGSVTTELAPTASAGSTSSTSSGGGGGHTDDPAPPGVPGSPIIYDHTRLGAAPETAKSDIEGDIRKVCGPKLCGVKVVISGKGDCTASITLSPVKPGGTVTVKARACPSEVTEESTTSESPASSSEPPAETTSG
ncbi:hypothetical protein [Amycolatopsis azurea]|uniref:Lipoprotein n=1 Tax=Amycolatopsis azurea DSM 43854 TaxID=1238180 RepID=M2PVR1_9PSEU|nr:hypothetical protein [Amycolatopsis azurea]EMD28718.1 hypothetical protein C791_8151 [Amycolatopsis azurea DSM 43854]OOC07831.1 hypothetical protein B0293_02765 [Amycolatopsis azurea DSM 43854]